MNFNIKLTFRGLCMLVPGAPIKFEDLEKGMEQIIGQVQALLPDAREEVRNGPDKICKHVPKLELKGSLQDESWELDGNWIEIDLPNKDIASPKQGLTLMPSTSKIARMEKVAPGSENIDDAFLVNPPGKEVAASFDLNAGSLEGTDISPYFVVFGDPSDPNAHAGKFASIIQVVIPVDTGEGPMPTLKITGKTEKTVSLQPKEGKELIEVAVSNICKEHETNAQGEPRPDVDFAVYYRLCPQYIGHKPIPIPISEDELHRSGQHEVNAESSRPGSCIPGMGGPRNPPRPNPGGNPPQPPGGSQ